ncbi:MAG TPA: RNA-binding cell elongation regulator Jag/EloR [Coriobacteriia bacterium]|nr:RNA-binding cell elongation regulator Jag/EloR [Coriobacteriia bacterium]
MKTECITEAQTVEEAVDAALEELGVQQDAVDIEVLQEPGRKMFGMGGEKAARVKVSLKAGVAGAMISEEVLGSDDEEAEEEALPPELMVGAADQELSDEELDRIADTAVTALKGILGGFGIEDPTVEEYEGDEGEIILDVIGGDLGLLIGRHGKTLDALQTAVGAITTRQLGFRYPVVVDVEGYRHRRRQKIEDMARKAADRASRQHVPVRMRPMTAYERRVVHVALRNDKRVVTGSEGVDPYRQVVVKPK